MKRACAILLSMACTAVPYFFTLSHKRHDFQGGKVTVCDVCFLYKFSLKYFSFKEEISDANS